MTANPPIITGESFTFHPADTSFIEGVLCRVPTSIQGNIKNTYTYQYTNADRQAANLYLLDVDDCLQDKTLLTLSDENIRTKAERLAKNCKLNDLKKAEAYLSSVGLPLPHGETDASTLARVKCPVWWERSLPHLCV